jgi:hypothetical protein
MRLGMGGAAESPRVEGEDVETFAGEVVHQAVGALRRYLEIEALLARGRGAMGEDDDALTLRAACNFLP